MFLCRENVESHSNLFHCSDHRESALSVLITDLEQFTQYHKEALMV